MSSLPQDLKEFTSLVEIVTALRGENGCPWDKEQTHETLTQYAIEEVFEFVEAVEKQNDLLMMEELGDNLFQVLLHSVIAEQRGAFTLTDVLKNLSAKMIRRHPHVFSGQAVSSTDDVIKNWEEIKKREKKQTPPHDLQVPTGLPALQRAYKLGKRTEKLQFDWSAPQDVFQKVLEETEELKEALAQNSQDQVSEELGDLLFTLAQLARHLKIEPEAVLRKANHKFETRFVRMLEFCEKNNKNFTELSATDKENLWIEVKKQDREITLTK